MKGDHTIPGLSKKGIWAVLFVAAVFAGAVFIFLMLKNGRLDDTYSGEISPQIQLEQQKEEPVLKYGEADREDILNLIPAGLKAVSLPVSFFGDSSILSEGSRVDIISTYYKKDTGILEAKRIISAGEIISLETGTGLSNDGGLYPGSSFLSGDISISGTAMDTGDILVMTFFLTDDEILEAFAALERGMLFLAICPGGKGKEDKIYGNEH